ncbi:MAG TPA: hypothetical protein VH207_10905 [Chthoniobacterales bacterium]|nr:hypothetical protein [Chthoniobacterales bacterium]
MATRLADPALELHDGEGHTIKTNADWADNLEGEIQASGLAPQDARKSSILVNLVGGKNTAIVRGKDDTVGVALVDIYHLLAPQGFPGADFVRDLVFQMVARGPERGLRWRVAPEPARGPTHT